MRCSYNDHCPKVDCPLFHDSPKVTVSIQKDVPMKPAEPKFDYHNPEAIDEELKCPICLDPFVEPVVLKCCEHMLCKNCAEPCAECPLCRGMHKPFANPPRLIMNMLSRIDVSCQVCSTVVKRDAFPNHVRDVCPFPCPNGCGVPQTRATVAKHLDLCSYQIVPCDASVVGCKYSAKRDVIFGHHLNCSLYAQKDLLLRIQELEWIVRKQELLIKENTFSMDDHRLLMSLITREKQHLAMTNSSSKPSIERVDGAQVKLVTHVEKPTFEGQDTPGWESYTDSSGARCIRRIDGWGSSRF